jgi:hypothetical protein
VHLEEDRACSMCEQHVRHCVCVHTNTHQRYRDDDNRIRLRLWESKRTHTATLALTSKAACAFSKGVSPNAGCPSGIPKTDGGDLTEFVVCSCSGLVMGCVGANLTQPVVDALSRNVLVAITLRPFVDKAGEMTGSAGMSLMDFTA